MSCTRTGVLRKISTYAIAGPLSQARPEIRARLTARPSDNPTANATTHSSTVTTRPRSSSGRLSKTILKSHVYSIVVLSAYARQPGFDQTHQVARREEHDEVHQRDRRVNLHGSEGDAVHLHRLVEQFRIRERRGQRRGLRQLERTLDERRHHSAQSLGQDHAAERRAVAHAQRPRALPLAALDRHDAAAEYLGVERS